MTDSADWPSTGASFIAGLQERSSGSAWNRFVDVYGPLVYRFCRRRGLQDSDARDVAQEAFLAVREGIRRFDYDPSRARFRTWLGTIVVRGISRTQRGSKRMGQSLDLAPEIASSDAVWVVEFNNYVYEAALARVRPTVEDSTWTAFDLLWNQDLSPNDVARRLEKSIDWVYQVKCRVLRQLEKEVRFLTADIPAFCRD